MTFEMKGDAERAMLFMNGAVIDGFNVFVGPTLTPKRIVIVGGGLAGLRFETFEFC